MSRTTETEIHARLDRLERSNRSLRRVALALAAGSVLLLGTSMRPRGGGVLEGTGLRLIDAEGQVRLEASADETDVSLVLRGPDGGRRALWTAGSEEGLWLFDGSGVERVALVAGDDQGLYLQDEQGHDRIGLVTTEADEGLYFRGDRGLYVVRDESEPELRLVTR